MILRLDGINVFYDAIHAVRNLSLEMGDGEIVTLIGANGAGKSTTLKAISGLVRPRSGGVFFQGRDISRDAPDRIVRQGICHVPEGRRIFANLTVRENLELGAFTVRSPSAVKEAMDGVVAVFPRLGERLKQYGGTLSGGEQQMLAIGRALINRPKLMLMDEPSLGLAPLITREIFKAVREINAEGTTVLFVEQNSKIALSVAHRAYVMQTGKIVMTDKCENLLANDDVKKAYLGV